MLMLSHIALHKKSQILELLFEDGSQYKLPSEYLRVFSPSAEVRGHTKKERKLVPGKKDVAITTIEPVGNYAIKILFDDGHNTGLYTFEILHDLSVNYEKNWNGYLEDLKKNNLSR